MFSGSRLRVLVLATVFGLVAAVGLSSGPATAKTKKLKLGKEGSYVQVFKNKPGIWQDDTSVQIFTRNRKVVAVWLVSNYEFDGGGKCWPIGYGGTLMPDKTTTGPVHVEVHPKSPTPLNAKNGFTIKPTKSNPFYDNGGGAITGKLLPSGRLKVTAKLIQSANSFQGQCSTSFKAPKAKFKAFKVSKEIG
ncbi:MAG: hypothetical protein J0H66_05100 [Solirubrobacterales bacterium]|nr:hypothetical protein [Solirubrobacterales bacterium]